MRNFSSRVAKLVSLGLIASGLTTASLLPATASTCTASSSLSGTGAFGDPFLISTPGDLVFLAESHDDANGVSVNKYYKLTADLDMTGCTMSPIGSNAVGKEFQGIFLGENHTISKLILDRTSLTEAAGLFAYAAGADIKDLIIKDANIGGHSSVGAVVGRGIDTNLSNIRVEGSTLTASFQMVGGVAGELKDSDQAAGPALTVQNLVVTDSFIFGDNQVGGVVGNLTGYSTSTRLAFNNSTIYLNDNFEGAVVGGLVGQVDLTGAGSLSDSTFLGTINLLSTADQPVAGGLIGKLNVGNAFTISNSVTLGLMDSRVAATLGGMVGSGTNLGTITDSYLEMQFRDLGNGNAELAASPFGPGAPTLSDSFANATVHTSWVENSFPVAAQKNTSEIRTASTFSDAGWSIETSGDVIRAGATNTWLSNQDIQSGVPVLNWAFEADIHNTDCAPGRYSVDGLGPCVPASPGSFVPVFGSIQDIECPVGTFQPDSGGSSCIDAEPGHFVNQTGKFDDEQCTEGTYQDEAGQTDCKNPGPGFYATGLAQTEPIACAAGTFKSAQSADPCDLAPQGRYVPEPQATAAIDCEPGKYQDETGKTSCKNATVGHFTPFSGSAAPIPCPTGFYQNETGQTECKTPGAGFFASGEAQVAQVACEVGTYKSVSSTDPCTLAPAGRYVPSPGATQAVPCAPGTFQPNPGARECLLAPPGDFVAESGSISSTPCPTGATSELGATSCTGGTVIGGGGGGGGAPIPVVSTPEPLTSNPLTGSQQLLIQGPLGPIAVSPSLGSAGRTMLLEVGGSTISFAGNSGILFSSDGSASVTGNSPLEIAATGFSPGSQVVLYLIPVGQFETASFVSFATTELADALVLEDGSFSLSPQINAAPGDYVLQLSGTTDSLQPITLAFALEIKADQEPAFWTKKISDLEAKIYAKNIVGLGKVQFRLNGKEIAWVRALDATDPKLRVIDSGPMAGANYLVRTVKLAAGKNVLEIYVDGERLRRTAYSR